LPLFIWRKRFTHCRVAGNKNILHIAGKKLLLQRNCFSHHPLIHEMFISFMETAAFRIFLALSKNTYKVCVIYRQRVSHPLPVHLKKHLLWQK
jgi:hypothetical protein